MKCAGGPSCADPIPTSATAQLLSENWQTLTVPPRRSAAKEVGLPNVIRFVPVDLPADCRPSSLCGLHRWLDGLASYRRHHHCALLDEPQRLSRTTSRGLAQSELNYPC